MIRIKTTSRGLTFTVYVLPRSSKIDIVGRHQEALKIKLTAPPVGGAANKQCVQVLAKALALPKSALTIFGGQTSRLKQICIEIEALKINAEGIEALKNKLSRLGTKSA